MANVGIDVKVTNTVLGGVPNVNANSILFVSSATATDDGDMAFALNTPYLLRSVDDLETLGITEENNAAIIKHVKGFYNPVSGVDNSGTVLWLVGIAGGTQPFTNTVGVVLQTIANGFQFRPRNIIFAFGALTDTVMTPALAQTAIDALYDEGFATVALVPSEVVTATTPSAFADAVADASNLNAPMVGVVAVRDVPTEGAITGRVGGYMATLPVGTSIGDVSLPAFDDELYANASGVVPFTAFTSADYKKVGDKQIIFARTRAPKNGLWLNDGATAADPATALSTLEAGRVIASMVDDLRAFFVNYLNNKIPVTSTGDIQPTYKQVVLDNARASVITPYIESGDISDARLSLVALDNDMVGTRTWQVTLSILPAPTLRWIDGFVFYVKNL
ncbi:MAG: hypothetical protein IKB68_06405 [Rikenellaceae bacterium]|nr:hypothetical protein [Rikenellaceae bacterium]